MSRALATALGPGRAPSWTALVGFATRLNPLWLFATGGLLGLTGWL